jgi:3-dehydroquinate synthase
MSASFEIRAASASYSVHIESYAFSRYLANFDRAVVIADEFFQPQFSVAGCAAIFAEATEELKSLDVSPALVEKIRRAGANRQTHLVAVGGGILQDLSAFIASIYMRGLQWSYVPTTILAMVDSCIGGKSSINVGPYKNLVGTFHPPHRVLIDPALAQTLPLEHQSSGLIEAVKICFCRGEESFERHLSYNPCPAMSVDALEQVIVNSLLAKKWFIEIDEFDKKERLLLNFGHTFGHAIEGGSHYAISHGIAVGLGILCAIEFERQRGIDYSNTPRVRLLEEHLDQMLRAIPKLNHHLESLPLDDVLERFESDKKHGAEHYTLILVAETGEVVIHKIIKSSEAQARVKRAIQDVKERYS